MCKGKNVCPYCKTKIKFYHKLFFMNAFYFLKCTNCKKKLKIKKLNVILLIILLSSIIYIKVIKCVYPAVAWIVLIISLILNIFYVYNAELLPVGISIDTGGKNISSIE